jgi:hypothetical protein
VTDGRDRRPKPSDEFATWPPSAQEAYLQMKASAQRFRSERDAVRVKGAHPGEIVPVVVKEGATLDDLTLPWLDWMDGRVHRLKKNHHFDGDLAAVIEEARLAAKLADRGVLFLREQMGVKYQYVWFQFTDHAILMGDPCPCGGRKLDRLHLNLARCRRCGKTSTLSPR